MGIPLINAAAIAIGAGWWWLAFLRGRALLRTGRTEGISLREAALYIGGFVINLFIAVFDDSDIAEALVLMMIPSILLAIFQAGGGLGATQYPAASHGGHRSV